MPKSYVVDGTEYRFPDEMNDQQVHDVLVKQGVIKPPPAQSWADTMGLKNGLVRGVVDFGEGVASGAASTMYQGGDLIRRGEVGLAQALGVPVEKIPQGVRNFLGLDRVIDRPEVQRAISAPDTLAGKTGRFVEQGAEFLIPAARLPKAANAASLGVRLATEAMGAGFVAGLQTGGNPAAMTEAAETVGGLGALGAGLPKAAKAAAVPVLQRILQNNPRALSPAAIAMAERYGVPLTRGMEGGSRTVQGMERVLGHTVASDMYENLVEHGQKGIAQAAADLTGNFSVDHFAAGDSAIQKLLGKAKSLDTASRAAYDDVRAFADADAKAVSSPVTRTSELIHDPHGRPFSFEDVVTTTQKYPVDLSEFQKPMRPVYDFILSKVPALQRDSDPALTYLKELMENRSMNALDAEEYLSKFKQLARESKIPELRDRAQGLAAQAISKLQPVVDKAVGENPDARLALEFARGTWKERSRLFDLVEQLSGDVTGGSGQTAAAQRLLRPADASYPLLKQVVEAAPEVKNDLGLAYLRRIFSKAEGGELTNPREATNLWKQIGTRTKALLYTPEHVRDVDSALELARRVAENPNPSGTGNINALIKLGMLVLHPVQGVPTIGFGRKLAHVLYDPRGAANLKAVLLAPESAEASRAMTAIKALAADTIEGPATH